MNKISFFLLTSIRLFFLTTTNSVAQNNSCSLKIHIVDLKSNNGKVLLQLFDDKEYMIDKRTVSIKKFNLKTSVI